MSVAAEIYFPQGEWLEVVEYPRTPDDNDAWLTKERMIRIERGDTRITEAPLPTVPFVFKD
jgi:hypothetical protein